MADLEGEVTQARPARRRKLRLTVLGILVLVAAMAIGLAVFRRRLRPDLDRPTIVAKYSTSPVVDGVIGPTEYGPPAMTMTWTVDNTLAGFHQDLYDETHTRVLHNPTESKPVEDLSFEVYAAYSDRSLHLAFRVHDQFVDAQEEDREHPEYNDGVEVFIDGDRRANDFGSTAGGAARGSGEGFQLLVDAAGHQLTTSADFANRDWTAKASRTGDGYLVEMEIPLRLIDTQDGPGSRAATGGSLLNIAMAVTDNDEEASRQVSYAYLRTPKQTISPWLGREGAWNFGLKLEPRFPLLGW
jgi:hypothetical protein